MAKQDKTRSPGTQFAQDGGGGVAVTFALALVPLVIAGGGALDYARAATTRTAMQAAADAAALAAARVRTVESDNYKKTAKAYVDTALTGRPIDGLSTRAESVDGGVQVTVSGTVRTTLLGVIGIRSVPVAATGVAQLGGANIEVSLVLDTTGSMANDMKTLRASAATFVDDVMGSGDNTGVRVAVVPYVASVNVGASFPMGYMDTDGASRWHARFLKSRWFSGMSDCDTNVDQPPQPPGPPSPPGPPPTGPGTGVKEGNLGPLQRGGTRMAWIASELFGIGSARADVTPPTQPPVPGTWHQPGTPHTAAGVKAFMPQGWTLDAGNRCYLATPPRVSHFDLFNRIPGARWKGCVEARAEPYDVTDEPPSRSSADTLFTPYFYADEPGDGSDPANPKPSDGGIRYENDYLPDVTYKVDGAATRATSNDANPIQGWGSWGPWQRMTNLFKYDGRTAPVGNGLKETAPTTYGPNRACPDEMLRLTSDKAKVQARIASLSHWNGGGTVSSEGVAWGWRALSPDAPFRDGLAYGAITKSIVLMSDGLSMVSANGKDDQGKYDNSVILSDYNAYGFLRDGRFPNNTYAGAVEHLNNRLVQVCQNARAKGIRVYAILFRETDPKAVSALRACASEGKMYYQTASQAALKAAFADIGASIGRLRLTR